MVGAGEAVGLATVSGEEEEEAMALPPNGLKPLRERVKDERRVIVGDYDSPLPNNSGIC